MAEAFLRSFDPQVEAYSAGTDPSVRVHPRAVKVMKEVGLDIAGQHPKRIDDFLDEAFDYVITVCDNAREHCPLFTGEVRHRLHIGFDDPAEATGTDKEIDQVFRRVRDEIHEEMIAFYSANRPH